MSTATGASTLSRGAATAERGIRWPVRRARRTMDWAVRKATASERMLPSILIVGTQKGGTVSLYEYLAAHPDVGRATGKEIQYFTHNAHRGLAWYRAHFPRTGEFAHTLEATPYYMFHPRCPSRIRAALPQVKVIMLLREPVARAYSQYQMNHLAYGYEQLDFPTAVAREQERLEGEEERILADERYKSFAHQHYSYVARGMYARQLDRWYTEFSAEQILVMASEEMFSDPAAVLRRVQAWLGLSEHLPSTLKPYNARGYEPLDSGLRAELKMRFEPDIARLRERYGVSAPWA